MLPVPQRAAAVARVRREVARAMDREHVLRTGESVVVACSGGPDSLALLDALIRLAPPRRLAIHVAHVDHGLREGSGAEADVVARVCARASVPFRAMSVAVAAGNGVPARARAARYAALRGLATETGATAIATGHTADDQAETVLMRALSQASPAALRGMTPRRGDIVRPLLHLWRADTAAYCSALGLTPVNDPSNRDPRYTRTRVRHELLPALEAVFPAARRRLVALADAQRRDL